jgi:hypothetical protein
MDKDKEVRLRKDRNWIKFRLAGSLNALKALPVNALTLSEREFISNAADCIEAVQERFEYSNQFLGLKSKKK